MSELTKQWIVYDPLTHAYVTGDGAFVAAEIIDNVECLADVVRVAQIRAEQRAKETP